MAAPEPDLPNSIYRAFTVIVEAHLKLTKAQRTYVKRGLTREHRKVIPIRYGAGRVSRTADQ